MNLSTPEHYRRTVLDFCLAPLRQQLGEDGAGDVPTVLEVNGQKLEVDAWEMGALRETLILGGVGAKPWSALVTEGVAFLIGCKLKRAGWVKKASNADALVTFVAAGLALTIEIQNLIDQLIVAGGVTSAKRLTQFRHKILQDAKELRRLLADADSQRTEVVAADLTAPPQHALPVSSSVGISPKGAREYKPRDTSPTDPLYDLGAPEGGIIHVSSRREADRARRMRAMSILLFASAVVWMIFFMPRLFEPKAQVLQKTQFRHLPAISNVTARPPSLYVEVRSQAWDALDPTDQQELLEEIGRIAIGANYNGAQIKKENAGAVVGRWLRQQGAELVSGS